MSPDQKHERPPAAEVRMTLVTFSSDPLRFDDSVIELLTYEGFLSVRADGGAIKEELLARLSEGRGSRPKEIPSAHASTGLNRISSLVSRSQAAIDETSVQRFPERSQLFFSQIEKDMLGAVLASGSAVLGINKLLRERLYFDIFNQTGTAELFFDGFSTALDKVRWRLNLLRDESDPAEEPQTGISSTKDSDIPAKPADKKKGRTNNGNGDTISPGSDRELLVSLIKQGDLSSEEIMAETGATYGQLLAARADRRTKSSRNKTR